MGNFTNMEMLCFLKLSLPLYQINFLNGFEICFILPQIFEQNDLRPFKSYLYSLIFFTQLLASTNKCTPVAKQIYFESLKVFTALNTNKTVRIAVTVVTAILDFTVPNTEMSVLCKLSI